MRKKAALCLLRLYRKNPDVVNVDGWYALSFYITAGKIVILKYIVICFLFD